MEKTHSEMCFEEEMRTLADVVPSLPRRVRIVESADVPTVDGNHIVVLELVKSIQLFEGVDRKTNEVIRIPCNYEGHLSTLSAEMFYSAEDIKNGTYTWFSVENPFVSPVSPWERKTIESGNIAELTDIEHDGGIVVRLGDDPIFIAEATPLTFRGVLEYKTMSLQDIIKEERMPLNIIIQDNEDNSNCNHCFPPGNYILSSVVSEDVILGYLESTTSNKSKQQFLLPVSCEVVVQQEITTSQAREPYKNAFFVPLHFYDDKKVTELYIKFIRNKNNLPLAIGATLEIPSRIRKSKTSKKSVSSECQESETTPVRPARKRKENSARSERALMPQERQSSLEENRKCDTLRETGCTDKLTQTEHLGDRQFSQLSNRQQYTELHPEQSSGHIYDEMKFEESDANPRPSFTKNNFLQICCGCGSREKDKSNTASVHEMSVSEISACLSEHGLTDLANICRVNRLDGVFISNLTIEELMSEPFNLTEEQVEIVTDLISGSR